MAHDHHHHGESLRDYFVEQLLTIFVVGALGCVGVLLYYYDRLRYVLAEQFWTPVLIGSIAILVLVVLRAVTIWREAGEMQAHKHDHDHAHEGHDHKHDHDHGPDCDHDHSHDHAHTHDHAEHAHAHSDGDDDHGHSHSHDLAWVFARMLVLFFPVALFLIGVPNSGFSPDRLIRMLGSDQSIGQDLLNELVKNATVESETKTPEGNTEQTLRSTGGTLLKRVMNPEGQQVKLSLVPKEGTVLSFDDLNYAAYDDAKRESMRGQTAILSGRFKRLDDKEFSLFRLKMTCCAADTVPLKVRIITKTSLSGFNDFEWVQVKGQIQFVQIPNTNPVRYMAVILVDEIRDIEKKETPKNEYQ